MTDKIHNVANFILESFSEEDILSLVETVLNTKRTILNGNVVIPTQVTEVELSSNLINDNDIPF